MLEKLQTIKRLPGPSLSPLKDIANTAESRGKYDRTTLMIGNYILKPVSGAIPLSQFFFSGNIGRNGNEHPHTTINKHMSCNGLLISLSNSPAWARFLSGPSSAPDHLGFQ